MEIFVSNKAKDSQRNKNNCGSKEEPCSTIQEAIVNTKINNQITIEATDIPYTNCPVYVDKWLSFTGTDGKPLIDCEGNDAFKFTIESNAKDIKNQSAVKIDVSNLKIQNSNAGFTFLKSTENVNLQLKQIEFKNNRVDVSWKNSKLAYLVMKHVSTSGPSGYGIHIEGCDTTKVQISNTKFYGKYCKFIATDKSSILNIDMDRVTFDMGSRVKTTHESPMQIVTTLVRTAITINTSSFINHVGKENSMMNITTFQKPSLPERQSKKQTKKKSKGTREEGRRGPKIKKKKGPEYAIIIKFEQVIFENNTIRNGSGGAIWFNFSIAGDAQKPPVVTFNGSSFIGNSALKGGAVWFSKWRNKMVIFNGTTFIGNKAVDDDGRGGEGGALFGLAGKYRIKFCKFQHNMATKSGGTLYLFNKISTSMIITNSTFQNQERSWSRTEGDIMYLNDVQTFFLGKVVFNLSSANSGESMFLYEGKPSVLRISNMSVFICPKGFNYEEPKYTLKLGRTKPKYYPTYHIFAFSCKPCQDLFYSTTRGLRQANLTAKNGECHQCPYGASCNGTIRARANFWGRMEGNKIEMVPCPKGYCCNREPCESYDSCRKHRTGTLCGHCMDGYTESMSSPACFKNEKCNGASWLWPIINVIVIFVFFCFHQEVRNT